MIQYDLDSKEINTFPSRWNLCDFWLCDRKGVVLWPVISCVSFENYCVL